MTSSRNVAMGRLYLIPISLGESRVERYQPLGNLELIQRISFFVVENARTARQYIKSVCPERDISQLEVVEVDKHEGYRYPKELVLSALRAGQDVGLMSEAGCPAIADPGNLVVQDCHRAGVEVVPLVGPSSILLSLMSSGFNGQRFCFHGYLPFDKAKRTKQLQEIQTKVQRYGETHIFIEAPYRNDKLLDELIRTLPASQLLCMGVDLTTAQEEIRTLPLGEWKQLLSQGATWHKRPAIFLLGKY